LPDTEDVVINFDDDLKLNIYNPCLGVVCRELYLKGTFENNVKVYLKQIVINGMVVLDVGADMGYYTILFAKWVGSNGKVIAFEPSNYARSKFIGNITLNCFNNAYKSDFALSNENGPTCLINPGVDSRIFA